METAFISRFREAGGFDMEFRPGVNLLKAIECSGFPASVFSLPEMLSVRDEGKRIFTGVSARNFARLLREAVDATQSDGFTADELGPLKAELDRKGTPAPKQLVFCRLLEEIAVRSEDENVWREAMNILAGPLYEKGVSGTAGTALETICISCLSGIRSRCSDQGKAQMYSEIMSGASKVNLFMEAVCGSLFTKLNREREQRAAIALAGMDDPIVLAALVAHSLRSSQALPGMRNSVDLSLPWMMDGPGLLACELAPDTALGVVLDQLARSGAAMQKGGGSMLMALAQGDPCAPVDTEVYHTVVSGFRHILSPKPLPHPWFLGYRERNGFPIPKFDPRGIQVASFLSLASMPSPVALDAAVLGITQLVVPHIRGVGPNGVEVQEPSVRQAMGLVKYTLQELLSRNPAVQPFQAENAMRLLFAHPEYLPLEQADRMALLGMSPLFCRIAMASSYIGAEHSPVSQIASECLRIVLACEPQGGQAAVQRRVETFMGLQSEMFGSGSHMPEPGFTREFLHRIAGHSAGAPLPPIAPKGKITQGK
jgi:hypothetical protein